ncbi:DUF4062 domain-containing protein [Halomonas sp. ISL-60]|uniref:DUF4062 domain-containing protein n=1 Tax=Halomonas sp. ISL-56 TaxID=2819149 RepID=UPI001BEA9EC2|nr:DUF4062 domain-containing protein [Halomonas sp. ISL-56]MBT2773648.1 DUF4062 domain-containing protein [Halomonas sp. ISL-60]MBT2802067.1 DUF4062 domain-containing protein [Halomonas sp. ISL-56]
MEKRYQIFVSSTFADLQEERQQVIQALMEMDCIPAGMELFPAADEEQWEFIKRIVDDCDYYLLIIGGRYGSVTSEGVSYTEMEYNYAVERGLRVIALLHDTPEELPAKKVEMETEAREKLATFRDKVATGRLVKFWNRPDQLPGLVALNLSKTIKMYPALGWVRADQGDSTELLRQINELRQENEKLKKQAESHPAQKAVPIETLSQGDDIVSISGESSSGKGYSQKPWKAESTWNELFSVLGPDLYQYQGEYTCQKTIAEYLVNRSGAGTYLPRLDDQSKKVIKIQFIALGLITVNDLPLKAGGYGLFWKITDAGKTALMQIMSVKRDT